MRFCDTHWAKLRAAIAERGLSHLVAKGGEQAARNLASEIREGPTIQTFDPLMAAHNAIWFNAMQTPVGLSLLVSGPDGAERCPICYPRDVHAEHCPGPPECPITAATFESWIDHAADGAKAEAERLLADAKADA